MILYYNSYIVPIFDYCCIIWSRSSVLNTNRLLKLQKRAARIILGTDIMTPLKHMFKELQWLSFLQRVHYHTCLLVYKSLNGLVPEYLSQLFTKTSEMHSRNLRSADNDKLRVPFARTKYFAKSFSVEGAKLTLHQLRLQVVCSRNFVPLETAHRREDTSVVLTQLAG